MSEVRYNTGEFKDLPLIQQIDFIDYLVSELQFYDDMSQTQIEWLKKLRKLERNVSNLNVELMIRICL